MKEYFPKHARCYCAVIVGAGVTVAGAAAAAIQAKKAADAQKKALSANDPAAAYGSKMSLPDFQSNVNLPAFDATSSQKDLLQNAPYAKALAAQYTKQGVNLRNFVLPNASGLLGQASTDLMALGKGQVSQDQLNNANQSIAERTGGTYDPSNPNAFAGANPFTISSFATGIGKTSQDNVNQFLSTLPGYEQLGQSFVYTPEKAAASAMDLLNAKYNYALGAGKLQNDVDTSTYNAIVNQIKANSTGDPQVIGARNDALLSSALTGIQGNAQNKETMGALQGLVGMFAKTGANSVTQYGTAGQAYAATKPAATAGYSNVSGMGWVPKAAPTANTTYS